MRIRLWIYWAVPGMLFCSNAWAWGLATHVYFAQLLVWAVPLLDPKLRVAARALPELVLAGACLPDLALVGKAANTPAFGQSHDWNRATTLLKRAGNDADRALALGYCSHLFVDVVAHNHFVPAHERMWLRLPMVTHAVAEWIMDAHIARHLLLQPSALMRTHETLLTDYVAREFDCDGCTGGRAVRYLQRATGILYGSALPHALRLGAATIDRRLTRRLNHYVAQTAQRLPQINRFLVGESPPWRADVPCPERTRYLRDLSFDQLRGPLPLPASLYG